jgi:translation initiation factor eIF-2B subunit alpha
MFELVNALEEGAEALKARSHNSISLTAGCELFVAFVTLFPHESEARRRHRSIMVALYLTDFI